MADVVEVWNGPLLAPGGRPLHRAVVPIVAVAPANPLLLNGEGSVLSRITPDTNTDGIWRAGLVPTSRFQRADAYYTADERKYGGELWMFRVPDDGGPYRLEDLLLFSPPTGDGPSGPVQKMTDLEDVETQIGQTGFLVRGTDGIYRLQPAEPDWGDPTRWRLGPPEQPTAPAGAVHIDVTTGNIYRYREG